MPDQRFPQSGREDAFGDLVTKGVQNSLDLPAFHSFSEERYRFIENGTRIQDPDADLVEEMSEVAADATVTITVDEANPPGV